jgi:hypothetical protein
MLPARFLVTSGGTRRFRAVPAGGLGSRVKLKSIEMRQVISISRVATVKRSVDLALAYAKFRRYVQDGQVQ